MLAVRGRLCSMHGQIPPVQGILELLPYLRCDVNACQIRGMKLFEVRISAPSIKIAWCEGTRHLCYSGDSIHC